MQGINKSRPDPFQEGVVKNWICGIVGLPIDSSWGWGAAAKGLASACRLSSGSNIGDKRLSESRLSA
jgi:hypothetical protein